jgi:AbrB family looped-hinge helix DNA binding protein
MKGTAMHTATLTSKGQITIPVRVRKALGLSAGDSIDFIEMGDGTFAIRSRTGSIRDLEGCVPRLDYVPTIEEMNDAIADAASESYLSSIRRARVKAPPRSRPSPGTPSKTSSRTAPKTAPKTPSQPSRGRAA